MAARPDTPPAASPPPRSWAQRMLWFVGLWLASVTLLGIIAYGIRLWLGLS